MQNVVIIGAGPTGLSTAYHLEQQNFFDYTLYEKQSSTGGLCGSVHQDGFTFDYTGHLLHINDDYFKSFIETVVGFKNLTTINRRSFIYSHNNYLPFPFQSNLYHLPKDLIIQCIDSFIKKPQTLKKNASFYEWALHQFGKGITDAFFVPYQEKIFAYDIHKISSSWTSRFVPKVTLKDILEGAIQERKEQQVGYNAQFFYPTQGGISFVFEKLTQQIQQTIKTDYCVESIDTKNKIVTFSNGDFQKYDTLVTTMPLDTLLHLLKTPGHISFKTAQEKLLCNSVLNFNIGLNKKDLSNKHWIYLPEEQFPHYRLGFYHNMSPEMVPKNCSSLYGEIAFLPQQKKNLQQTLEVARATTKKLLNFTQADIATEKVIEISHAYVIYDFWREKHLASIHETLQSMNIYSIGRYGEWKYASMQEAILDGKKMAEKITEDALPKTEPFTREKVQQL